MIPIILKLKKEIHKNIAGAQDIIVEEIYRVFNDAVLHGGTAIWRCYNGNRFSEDVDVYLTKDVKKLDLLFDNLKKQGFEIEKKKIGENSVYSKLKINRNEVRFEALFKKVSGSLKEYETAEGNLITVYTLTPEEFIKEKVAAYLKRNKVRDLYDIFFLLRFVSNPDKIRENLNYFVKNFEKPADETEIKVLILSGLVPTAEKMLDYITDYTKK